MSRAIRPHISPILGFHLVCPIWMLLLSGPCFGFHRDSGLFSLAIKHPGSHRRRLVPAQGMHPRGCGSVPEFGFSRAPFSTIARAAGLPTARSCVGSTLRVAWRGEGVRFRQRALVFGNVCGDGLVQRAGLITSRWSRVIRQGASQAAACCEQHVAVQLVVFRCLGRV